MENKTKIKWKSYVLACINRKTDALLERVVCFFHNLHRFSVGYFYFCGTSSINGSGGTVVGSGKHKMLNKIGPALSVIVLAATAAERIHRKKRSPIVNSGMVVL